MRKINELIKKNKEADNGVAEQILSFLVQTFYFTLMSLELQ